MSTPAKKAAPTLADRLAEKEEADKKSAEEKAAAEKAAAEENEKNNFSDDESKEEKSSATNSDDTLQAGHYVVEETDKPVDHTDTVTAKTALTPSQLSAETPEQSQKRYGISDEIPDDVHNDPTNPIRRGMGFTQIPSGTHLHPDIAIENYNRGIGQQTENGVMQRTEVVHVYATEAPYDDKGRKGVVDGDKN